MNKREKYWVKNVLYFVGIIIIFIPISVFNIIKFNNSFMQEETQELYIFENQVEWAIKPYLEINDTSKIKQYCKDFAKTNINLRIFDGEENLIASSANKLNKEPLKKEFDTPKKTHNFFKLKKILKENKEIGITKQLSVKNKIYYIELLISEENVLKTITEARAHLLILLSAFLILFIAIIFYIYGRLRKSFNELDDSVKKIADGDLNAIIKVPQIASLEELALSVKKMTLRLKNQIKRLEQLEKYKSDFIQNFSHEIKTPITAINSAIEFLQNQNSITSGTDKECFEIIQFQVRTMNKLVNDILNLSEIEMEKTLEEKPFKLFNLNSVIENSINNFVLENVKINYTSTSDITILGDKNLISTAITNIIGNAVKYSLSEKIDISLEIIDDKIKIQIRDYGIGIEKTHLPHLFEKFYRVDKARSRETGGTGLGLAIAQNIVQLHNGDITVDSIVGSGTTFTIELPQNS